MQRLIPGKKVCCKCNNELDLLLHSDILADGDPVFEVEEVYLDERLNKSLVHLDRTSVKKYIKDWVEGFGKRKFKETTEKLTESFSDILPGLDKLKICSDYEELMDEFKGKFLSADTREEDSDFDSGT